MNKEIIQYWTPDFDEGLCEWHIETIMNTLDSLLMEYPNVELKVIGDFYTFDKKKQDMRLNDLKLLEKSMNNELFNDLQYNDCDLRKKQITYESNNGESYKDYGFAAIYNNSGNKFLFIAFYNHLPHAI